MKRAYTIFSGARPEQQWCEPVKPTSIDLDASLKSYTLKRSRRGHPLNGRTQAQAPREATGRKTMPAIVLQFGATTIDEPA